MVPVADVLSLFGICSEVVNMGVALALLKTMQKQNLIAMHPTLYIETMRVRATTSWAKPAISGGAGLGRGQRLMGCVLC